MAGSAADALAELERARKRWGIASLTSIFGTSLGALDDLQSTGVSSRLIDVLVAELAQEGRGILNGGYLGTMGGIAQAVVQKGGRAFGLAAETITDPLQPDLYTELLVLPDHWSRLSLLVQGADSIVVLPGGIGTLAEVSLSLWLIDRGLMRPKPVIFLGDYWKDMLNSFQGLEYSYRYGKGSLPVFIDDEDDLRSCLELFPTVEQLR